MRTSHDCARTERSQSPFVVPVCVWPRSVGVSMSPGARLHGPPLAAAWQLGAAAAGPRSVHRRPRGAVRPVQAAPRRRVPDLGSSDWIRGCPRFVTDVCIQSKRSTNGVRCVCWRTKRGGCPCAQEASCSLSCAKEVLLTWPDCSTSQSCDALGCAAQGTSCGQTWVDKTRGSWNVPE